MTAPLPRKAVFLDRDDTLVENIPYLGDPDQLKLLPGVATAVAQLAKSGYLLYLFTNQSGIRRGLITLEQAGACNRRTAQLLGLTGGFRAVCIAPEHPDDPPVYRKPEPRFILERIEEDQLDPALCWMVGDHSSDIEAGRRAGIQTARVGCSANQPEQGEFTSLAAFVTWLLRPDVSEFIN